MTEKTVVRLYALAALVNDKNTAKKDPSKPYVGLEHIPSGSSTLSGFAESTDSISTNNVFRQGDILFGKLRPQLRKSVCAPFEGYCSTDILVLRPREGIDRAFATFILQSDTVFADAIRTEEGTKMPRCSWATVKESLVYCPEPTRQKRIGLVLSSIDQAIHKTEALIEKYQQIKAGLMHDLFTRGIGPDGKLRPPREQAPELYQETPIGWIPKAWSVGTIGSLFNRRVSRGIPGLPIMSIAMGQGLVHREEYGRRVETNLRDEQHLLVKAGDIAYNMMRMWQGVLGRAHFDCLVSPAYVVVEPTHRLDSAFAEHLLSTAQSIAKFKLMSYGVVDDRLRLYASDLMRIPLAAPDDLHEQRLIEERITAVVARITELERDTKKLRNERVGLMRDVLTGKVPVNPDPPEPANV